MSRHSIILSGLAVAGFLALGTAPGRADADVDGTDHSKLNHGVLGKAPPGAQAAAPAAAPLQASLDKDVAGTDHSKLNHGVLGVAPAGSAPAAAAAAPTAAAPTAAAPTTWAAPAK